jgi:Na+-transporting NADH:ubiquinone oxidoreductase subunit C
MRKEDIQTVGFAATVCVICSLIISAAAFSMKEKQLINIETDRRLNVLQAFGEQTVVDGVKLTTEEVAAIFENSIREVVVDPATGDVLEGIKISDLAPEDIYWDGKEDNAPSKLAIYQWVEGDKTTKVAFPVAGMGLWSTVYSFMALESDFASLAGATFYGHKETPGLGAECSADWFMEQFTGKKLFKANGEPNTFEVVKGAVKDKYPDGNDHAVDGMSGATMTGNGIQKFINDGSKRYNVYFNKLRKS